MRIFIRETGEKDFRLLLPTGLVLNGLTASILARAMKQRGVPLSAKQLRVLFRTIRRYKHAHPDWKLVEVTEANGDRVEVKI